MIAQIRGVFKIFDGTISITNENITTTSIDMWIDIASIDTGNKERDEQLRGPEFFNTASFLTVNCHAKEKHSPP